MGSYRECRSEPRLRIGCANEIVFCAYRPCLALKRRPRRRGRLFERGAGWGLDGQQFTLTMPELDALPRVKISANEHGAPHVFDGALLGDVLAKSALPPAKQFTA